ncbi:MAG: hypothetical protein ACI4JE_03620 [Ruminococcus sp.]
MKKSQMRKRAAAALAAIAMTASFISAVPSNHTPLTYSQGAPIVAAAADSAVAISESAGYSEGAYVKWASVSNATGYNVYCDGTQIDSMLIRQYPGCFRADAVGLKAGSHTLRVVPVIGGKEDSSKAAESTVAVTGLDRTGFAFNGQNGACGAYNADGTLKSNAVVLYITESTKDTVSMDVVTDSKGTKTTTTGLQNIIYAIKKGYDSRPVVFRFIGTVTDPAVTDKGDLTVDGGSKYSAGMTIEGIGEDATARGFGFRIKNISNLEIRNLGVMLVDSDEGDNISLQQGNDHVWVHNCDFFYGEAGTDSDQAKGDGALDCKKSTYITFSYNHFFDSGKCNLLGLSEGTTDGLYITYHHNWYDHSDSRHPRVRYYSAHVYNNYYDGNSKYGMGSTLGSSIFSENNYFRNCKYPMLTSMQGSDIATGAGTFSSEDGGTIKAFGNYMEGQKAFVPYSENNTEFDAYVASSRNEKVPSSVTSKKGGNTYNNFDTGSEMYSYTADAAADVPSIVKAKAGRLGGGDFSFTFTSADDESYDVNSALMSALRSYQSSVIAIGSGFKEDTGSTTPTTTAPAETTSSNPTTTVPAATTQPTTKPIVTGENVIYASPNGNGDGSSIDKPTNALTAINSVKAGGVIYLLDGTYKFSETILIDQNNSGTAGNYKTISAYPGADVVWDFSGQGDADPSKRGIVLDGNYWDFYGFEITKAADNGMLLSGSNNKIEMMEFNDNQDTGLQISRYRTDAASISEWPSNNLILNCTAKNNCDNATMENADGFAAKLTCGEGNVFDGCMSYNNSDDGWDLYAKTETGPIGVVTIRNCVAFRNGFTEFGEGYGGCDGNGFKLGGSAVGSAHVVENCLAFENLNCGFTDNNNPLLGSLTDCTSYNNGVGGNGKPNVSCYRCTDTTTLFTNVMSYINTNKTSKLGAAGIKISNDKLVGQAVNTIYYNSKYYYAKNETMENGSKLGDIITPSDSDFITLEVPVMGTDFHSAWRNSDGSVNPGGFAETPKNGTYASVGYHMSDGTTRPVETTTTAGGGNPEQTTTTTKPADIPPVAGGYVHNFTLNGSTSSFYTISGNLSTSKGTVSYAGLTLTQCLKIETATSIDFTSPSAGKLTLVFAEPAATIKVDGTKYTSSGDGIITVDLGAGSHSITKADTANLFYMVYAENSSSETTTEPTTQAPDTDIIYGDASLSGTVDINDVVIIMCYAADPSQNSLSDEQLDRSDVYQRGDGVNASDAISIQKYLSKQLSALPESYK